MEGTPTDSADVPNQRTPAERAAAERAASLRAVFASSPRPGQGPEAPGRAPGEITGSWRIAEPARPGSAARDAASPSPRRRKRRLWLVPFVVVLLAIGVGAAYVALRGNPLHGNSLLGNVRRADDRIATVVPTVGESPDPAPAQAGFAAPAPSVEPSVSGSATASAPTPDPSASLSPTASPTGRPNPHNADLALHKKVKSLSDEQPGYPAAAAVDGDLTTRWSSGFSDPQWIRVDLAAVWSVTDIKLDWENASAKAYHVDVSLDAKHWKTVYRTVTGGGGVRDIPIPPTPARFVRMYGTERNSQYGYSLLEFEVR